MVSQAACLQGLKEAPALCQQRLAGLLVYPGSGRGREDPRPGGPQSYLQHVLPVARAGRDLVLAGAAEVPFGAVPAHPGPGLPADHSPEGGGLP